MVKENRDIEQDKKQILKIGLLTDEVFEKNYQQKCKENDELLWAVIELANDDFSIKDDYINKKEYALIRNRVSEEPLSFCYRYLKNGIKTKLSKNYGITSLKDIRSASTLFRDVYKMVSSALKFIKAIDGGGAQDNQRNDLITHLKNSTKLSKNHYGLGLFAGEYFTKKRCSSINKIKEIDSNKAFSMHIKDFGSFCCDFISEKVQELCNIDDETKQYVSHYFSEIKVVYEDLAKTQQSCDAISIQLNATQTNNLW